MILKGRYMNKRNIDDILDKYYSSGYVEDERLTRDKMHYIEFITTTNYIDKYLPLDKLAIYQFHYNN